MVTAIYPKAIIQDNVVNYDVVIDIKSSYKGLLRPEMTTSVTIYQKERKGVLMIPRKVIIREEGHTYVFVKGSDGSIQKRPVKTGISSGKFIEVVSGLREGDIVVVGHRRN